MHTLPRASATPEIVYLARNKNQALKNKEDLTAVMSFFCWRVPNLVYYLHGEVYAFFKEIITLV